MKNLSQSMYRFRNFKFDAARLALFHQDELIKNVDKKSLEVLAALLRSPNIVVTHDEIIDQVWKDNSHGVTALHVNQYVSKLRRLFAQLEQGPDLIDTLRGRGYMFAGEVEHDMPNFQEQVGVPSSGESISHIERITTKSGGVADRYRYLLLALLLIVFLLSGAWFLYPNNDVEEIRRVVKESQMYESLVLYKNPGAFKEDDFDKYWTGELDVNTNYDRRRIREAVKKMLDEGRHYGDETKCEQFEFQSVEIDKTGEMALVRTLEKWFVAVYFNDGSLQRNRYVGPYFVSYIVRKVGGRWLIEKSNTARVNRPTPTLTKIEPMSDLKAGVESRIKLFGQDFESETVLLQVTGPGCPIAKPCKVPNLVLREYAQISDTTIENVPITLASGEFQLVVHNGDSKPSGPIVLVVP